MAVRNLTIVNAIIASKPLEIEQNKERFTKELNLFFNKANDFVCELNDVLDTFNYYVENGFIKELETYKGASRHHGLYICDDMIFFEHPSNRYPLMTDGKNLYVAKRTAYPQDFKKYLVKDIVNNVRYKKEDDGEERYYVQVYSTDNKYFYTLCTESFEGILKSFITNAPKFIREFNNDIDIICGLNFNS